MKNGKNSIYNNIFKRWMDFLLAFIALIILSPLLILLCFLGVIMMKGNPFFIQTRIGLDEKEFHLIKYRSMSCAKDKEGNLLPDAQRLNPYGKFLRKTSLDELGELLNIIKGDMSIIGPRPLLPDYLPYYTEEERKRHSVRPGLTGLAQVNGRSFISWEEIFQYDLTYVNSVSLKKDIEILFLTVKKVFLRSDVADTSEAVKDANGQYHFFINGKECTLHQPLNKERSHWYATGNRE